MALASNDNMATRFVDFYREASNIISLDPYASCQELAFFSTDEQLSKCSRKLSTFLRLKQFACLITFLEGQRLCMAKEYYYEQHLELLLNRVGEISDDFVNSLKRKDGRSNKKTAEQSIQYLLSYADMESPDYWRPWQNHHCATYRLEGEEYSYSVAYYKEDSALRSFSFSEKIVRNSDNHLVYSGEVFGRVFADYLKMEDREETYVGDMCMKRLKFAGLDVRIYVDPPELEGFPGSFTEQSIKTALYVLDRFLCQKQIRAAGQVSFYPKSGDRTEQIIYSFSTADTNLKLTDSSEKSTVFVENYGRFEFRCGADGTVMDVRVENEIVKLAMMQSLRICTEVVALHQAIKISSRQAIQTPWEPIVAFFEGVLAGICAEIMTGP